MKHTYAIIVDGKLSQVAYAKLKDATNFMKIRAMDMDKDGKPEIEGWKAKYHYIRGGEEYTGEIMIRDLEVFG